MVIQVTYLVRWLPTHRRKCVQLLETERWGISTAGDCSDNSEWLSLQKAQRLDTDHTRCSSTRSVLRCEDEHSSNQRWNCLIWTLFHTYYVTVATAINFSEFSNLRWSVLIVPTNFLCCWFVQLFISILQVYLDFVFLQMCALPWKFSPFKITNYYRHTRVWILTLKSGLGILSLAH